MKIKRISNPVNHIMEQRTSVRKYDPTVKIGRDEMTKILQDAMSAPSSLNLQPWRFVVIDSPQGKELIKPYMLFNALQLETSSAIIAVFGDLQNVLHAEEIYAGAVELGLMPNDTKEKMVTTIHSYLRDAPHDKMLGSVMLDCGLVCMQLMLAAKAYGYDTNPIGGFMKEELAEALGFDTQRYVPALLISIGKSADKVKETARFSVDQITQWK